MVSISYRKDPGMGGRVADDAKVFDFTHVLRSLAKEVRLVSFSQVVAVGVDVLTQKHDFLGPPDCLRASFMMSS